MNILITGASGFIGSHLCSTLASKGYELTLCVRNKKKIKKRWPQSQIVEVDFSMDTKIETWLPRLVGVDIVINTVGIISESATQSFESLHTLTPCALFKACKQTEVKKIIQVSALGADETASSKYHLSKHKADDCLKKTDLNWTILLPSVVFGHGGKSMTFFRAVAAQPLIPVFADGNQKIQPIYVGDLVKVILNIVHSEKFNKQALKVVGPEKLTIREVYTKLRDWLDLSNPKFINIPISMVLFVGRIGDLIGNSAVSRENIQMLIRGNTYKKDSFVKNFAFTPERFDQYLNQTPMQQADRWHAGLYFLRPLLRLSLAFLWIYTAFISAFIYPLEQSYLMLGKLGISGLASPIMLYGASTVDLFLGIALLFSYKVRLVGITQILVIILYSALISISQPELWLHPFGPVSKGIPLIVATLIMVAMEKK